MTSRTAARVTWTLCLVAAAAMAGALAVDIANSTVDAFSVLGIPTILAFSSSDHDR